MKTHWKRMISDYEWIFTPYREVSTEKIVTNMAQGHAYTS